MIYPRRSSTGMTTTQVVLILCGFLLLWGCIKAVAIICSDPATFVQ